MSDEDFLKRWSRRKREVAAAEKPVPPPVTAHAPDKLVAPADAPDANSKAIVAALPPVESINAFSDAAAFLKAGVPAELTRAALRRVWTVDPSIRDFVGLAENSWDFTDPAAMPGFGPLEDSEEVRRMIARVVDEIGQVAQPDERDTARQDAEAAENSSQSNAIGEEGAIEIAPERKTTGEELQKQNTAQELGTQVLVQGDKENTASQHGVTEAQEKTKQLSHRIHGGALPR